MRGPRSNAGPFVRLVVWIVRNSQRKEKLSRKLSERLETLVRFLHDAALANLWGGVCAFRGLELGAKSMHRSLVEPRRQVKTGS